MLYPLKFKPVFKERIWGGRELEGKMNKKLPAGKQIGESWEISGVEGDISVVSNGNLRGNNLQEMVEIFMGELVGDRIYNRFGEEFPLLVKLIDARERLSLQVHPDDELARERHNAYGKTEMWYVIDARPEAELYIGFDREVSREEYERAVEEGRLTELLRKVEARAGDAFFIPAGTVHALGGGLLVAEIQETSDVTYRIDDWGRTGEDGNPRELHTGLALDAIDFSGPKELKRTPVPQPGKAVPAIESNYFTTNLLVCENTAERDYSWLDSFVIYMCIEGEGAVEWSAGTEPLAKGETLLIPAAEDMVTIRGNATILEIYIA